MSDFNYQEYLKSNPLLKEEVKDQLITESQEVQEETADVEETVNEKFSAFKSYDDIIGGIITRFGALKDYVKSKEPGALDDLQKVMRAFEIFDEKMAYGAHEELEESIEEEIEEVESSKMKVSELKAKIKEDILSLLQEEDEEVEVTDEEEVDVEDGVELEADPEDLPDLDAADSQEGLTADEKEIQDSLKIAYDNAVAIGDTKLADQIGNSITFFTRTHVVER